MILFYNDRIEIRLKKIADAKIRYGKMKLEYESKLLPKLFGWKFENSSHGNIDWMGSWDFYWDNEIIKSANKILRSLKYHQKCGEKLFGIDLYHEDAFYSWCEENEIPY